MSGYDNAAFQGDGGNVDRNANQVKAQEASNAIHLGDLDPDEARKEKRRIMKNVVVISFSFMLLFTAYQSMAYLQSSINKVTLNIRTTLYASSLRSLQAAWKPYKYQSNRDIVVFPSLEACGRNDLSRP